MRKKNLLRKRKNNSMWDVMVDCGASRWSPAWHLPGFITPVPLGMCWCLCWYWWCLCWCWCLCWSWLVGDHLPSLTCFYYTCPAWMECVNNSSQFANRRLVNKVTICSITANWSPHGWMRGEQRITCVDNTWVINCSFLLKRGNGWSTILILHTVQFSLLAPLDVKQSHLLSEMQ